jgi:hypothetical protein
MKLCNWQRTRAIISHANSHPPAPPYVSYNYEPRAAAAALSVRLIITHTAMAKVLHLHSIPLGGGGRRAGRRAVPPTRPLLLRTIIIIMRGRAMRVLFLTAMPREPHCQLIIIILKHRERNAHREMVLAWPQKLVRRARISH